jgi:hypothetical protein
MRGGGGPTGRAAIGADGGGALTEITCVVDAAGVCTEGGTTGRTGGALTGEAALGGATTDGEEACTGVCDGTRGATGGAPTGAVDPTLTGEAGGTTTGLVTEGAITGRLAPTGGTTTAGDCAGACVTGAATGAAGRAITGGAAASFFCVIARSTSPGREMFDRSILVLISSSPRNGRELDLLPEDEPSAEERMYTRTFSASCSSRELECVFFSVTPTNGSVSRIALLFTSSSRARSLMRTLLIRPFVSPRFS